MKNDIDNYKKRIKENLRELIYKNRLDDAKEVLNYYDNAVKDDIDIFSIKGVIAMMEGDMDEAERVLKEGLLLDDVNIDILYNLGFLFKSKCEYDNAFRMYNKALSYARDIELRDQIMHEMKDLTQTQENRLTSLVD